MPQLENLPVTVSGHVEPEFEAVRDSFLANFDQGQEIGAAVAVYYRGRLVVDLAGGLRDRVWGKRYSRETVQPVFSVSKGITALAANMLADRGQLDLDAPVASYWPEFAQAEKSEIPVRWLLTHQSGVLGLDHTVSLQQLLDWNLVVELLAAQAPDWKPGSKHGYHSMTYGFLVGEVVRRATGRTLGQYVAREIAGALLADLFIGLPKDKETGVAPVLLPELEGRRPRLPDSGPYAARVLNWISPPLTVTDVNRRDVRAAELPAANGIANARSLARMFASIIGPVDGVRCLSSQAMNRARLEQWRGLDVVMGVENAVGLGFLLPSEWCPLGGPGSFGTAGFGGSRAWANPELELAFAYTPNLCPLEHFDARETTLSRAAVRCATRVRANLGLTESGRISPAQ
jgi:CubicO group peptidase (beta-lactamase class C family)